MKSIKIECPDCKGTGLYTGMCERNGVAVQCKGCSGLGWTEYAYTEFIARQDRPDVVWVLDRNPGICVSPELNIGGMSYSDWASGKKFEPGMEMREYTCPYWWYHQKHELSRCGSGSSPGRAYSACDHFDDKKHCWEEFDKLFAQQHTKE